MAMKEKEIPPRVQEYLTFLLEGNFESAECGYCHFKDKWEHFSLKWKHIEGNTYEFIQVLKCGNCGFRHGWKWQTSIDRTVPHIEP